MQSSDIDFDSELPDPEFDPSRVFDFVPFRVMDASSTDLVQLEEIIDDAIGTVRFMQTALFSHEPLAAIAALNRAHAFLAQFNAPLPLE